MSDTLTDKQTTAAAHLEKWSASFEAIRAEYTALAKIFNHAPESKMSVAMFGMFEAYTVAVAELVGDDEDWLGWFAWENDNGLSGLEAKASNWNTAQPIVTTGDLLCLISNIEEADTSNVNNHG